MRTIKCKNGNRVHRFWDKSTRSSVTRVLDKDLNQIGNAEYDGNAESAKCSLDRLLAENGGRLK